MSRKTRGAAFLGSFNSRATGAPGSFGYRGHFLFIAQGIDAITINVL